MTTKRNAVIMNLYVDFVYDPNVLTKEQAGDELMAKLKTFAVLNQDLCVKVIKSPECPPDSDTIYLP